MSSQAQAHRPSTGVGQPKFMVAELSQPSCIPSFVNLITPQTIPSCENKQSHGLMARPFGLKSLVCFYCNKKTGHKYDGRITQFQCDNCGSENFLDENGEITDPPVATDFAAPADVQYTVPYTGSPLGGPSSSPPSSNIFCSTCIHNQHLYTSCLSQYPIETDPSHPDYKMLERKYYKFRANLEKQYPQVCADCEPKVLERMREAGKTAKTDYLRRLLQQSRSRRAAARSGGITVSGLLELGGKCLWYFGLVSQLLWHITGLLVAAQYNYDTIFESLAPPTAFSVISLLSDNSTALSAWGFRSSLASLWWNPKFKYLNNGFMNHIKGFGEWYKYQATLLLVRTIYYYMMKTSILADPMAPATLGAHIFGLGFVTYLAIAANHSLKVDMTRLWEATPQKLPNVGPSGSPNAGISGNTMADALDEVLATPSKRRSISPPSPVSYDIPQRTTSNKNYGSPAPRYRSSYISNTQQFQDEMKTPPVALKSLSLGDYSGGPSQVLAPPDQDQDQDMMDWSPVQSQSKHRAFNSLRPATQPGTQLFGQAPVKPEPGVMWYKVPDAPISPAHRLRNPPKQPRLRVSSQETKQNFFSNVGRQSNQPNPSTHLGADSTGVTAGNRRDVEFAQQKFFPPVPPSESGENLADLLTSFSLNSDPEKESPSSGRPGSYDVRHIFQAIALFLGLLFWNRVLYDPSEHTRNVTLAVMSGCGLIGARTLLDNLQRIQQGPARTAGAILGAFEALAAVYGVHEILSGRGTCENCAPLGSMLIGVMGVYEMLQV